MHKTGSQVEEREQLTGPADEIRAIAVREIRRSIGALLAVARWSFLPAPLRVRLQAALLRRSGVLDAEWYLSQNLDVVAVGGDPYRHFAAFGFAEGREPNPALARLGRARMPEVAAPVEPVAAPAVPRPQSGYSIEYVPKLAENIDFSRAPLSLIAFYLPQFHPIAENDLWWGKGFTEWTNVTKAEPQFVGHYQPHLPGELGFYDLRLIDAMREQVALAKLYGIAGFCFHHYWFAGKRLLERPVNQYLAATDIDFPFCICWANENWTRRWDGQESDVLIAQQHSPEDDLAFIDSLLPMFADNRYIRFNGRPVLIVYRVSLLPDPRATAARWRQRCIEAGVGDPYLVAARSFDVTDPRPYGFDAAVEFPPHQIPAANLNGKIDLINPEYRGNVYSYEQLADGFAASSASGYPLIKTAMPSWDNEARRPGGGHVFHGATPLNYAGWLRKVYASTLQRRRGDDNQPPLVFVNSWNEWAEGAHLEPDRRFGYAYLHATANVIRDFSPPHPETTAMIRASQDAFVKRSAQAIVLHLHYDDLFEDIAAHIGNAGPADLFLSLRSDIEPERCAQILGRFRNARLTINPNRGRDIQPFLQTLRLLRVEGYELACKIHGKKSPQRLDGATLRGRGLQSLLGSPAGTSALIRRFEADPLLGMVVPDGTLIDLARPERAQSCLAGPAAAAARSLRAGRQLCVRVRRGLHVLVSGRGPARDRRTGTPPGAVRGRGRPSRRHARARHRAAFPSYGPAGAVCDRDLLRRLAGTTPFFRVRAKP